MKRLLILIILISSIYVSAQRPKEVTPLINKLEGLYNKENPTEAIITFEKLNKIYQPAFINCIHNGMGEFIMREKGNGNCSNLLNTLYSKNIESINKIITPIYLWNESFKAQRESESNQILNKIQDLLSTNYNYKSKIELYTLLIIKEFDKKKIGDSNIKRKLLFQVQKNLNKNSFCETSSNQDTYMELSWARQLLAYSYNYQYENFKKKELYLKNAAKFSPNNEDLQNRTSYNVDVLLLSENTNYNGYKNKYFDYLNQKERINEAFNYLMEITLLAPTNSNIKKLKNYYSQTTFTKSFEILWSHFINSKFIKTPELRVHFKNETLDLSIKRDYWIYIDFWGTWCAPCIKELPEFNKIASLYNNKKKTKVKVYSFSCGSKNLEEFMRKHNYTFPVSEIDQNTAIKFQVSSFPTKILISPKNKYIKIPYGVDSHEYLKNYCLIEE
jgi:thiol-disulfide isomerase/thioredoxin